MRTSTYTHTYTHTRTEMTCGPAHTHKHTHIHTRTHTYTHTRTHTLDKVAARPEAAGKVIVVLLASHGIRYTAHPMWAQIKAEAAAALPLRPNTKKDAPLLLWKSETFVSAL
jgi:hypothetical protein